MVETIMDLKNNRKHTQEHLSKLRKIKAQISSKHVEALGVTLDDIINIETKGKWWLVGAAWKQTTILKDDNSTHELLELAKAQKMNTDTRKLVFITIMQSDDYIDCYSRLLKLGLKDKQQRDIVRVLVQMAQNSESFNMFYALVLTRVLQDVGYVVTFQFTLWDAFKEMETTDLKKCNHLAKLFAVLVKSNSVSLSLLRVLNFTSLKPMQHLFCTVVLYNLLKDVSVDLNHVFGLEKYPDLKRGISLVLASKGLFKMAVGDEIAVLKKRAKSVRALISDTFE